MTSDWRDSDTWELYSKRQKRYDSWTCQHCGQYGGTLHTHHITPVAEGGAKYDHDNLVTLCVDCHKRVHSDDPYATVEE